MINYSEIIEKNLCAYLDTACLEPGLHSCVKYSLMNAGKRIRPTLCLLIADMLSGSSEKAIPYACAVEMIHTYSLIHDDLPAMDNDATRRGKPSNHIVYGEGNAVLAGDALLSLAALILSKTDNSNACAAVMSGAVEMLNGQSMDINNKASDDSSLEKMYDGKTGGLFCSSILSAYYVSEHHLYTAAEWKHFALNIGKLFQVTDDILDQDKDAAENKTTFLTVHSPEQARNYVNSLTESLLRFIDPFANEYAFYLRDLIKSLASRTK